MLSTALLSIVLLAAPAATPKATPLPKKNDAKAEAAATPKADVMAKSDAGVKADTKKSEAAPKPMSARAAMAAKKPAATFGPARGEAFVAPSMASLGERWADDMTGNELGTEADRKAWLPALALGVRMPIGRSLGLELDGSGTRFSTPVPGGRTEGWVGHVASRASFDRGRFGGEIGALVRVADLASPATKARVITLLPSMELRALSAGGTEAFVAAWDNPVLPYGDEGWLRAGARRDWGRLAGELAVGVDPVFEGEKSTGPVLEAKLDIAAGKGTRLGVAVRAADEPMAAVVMRRPF